MQINPNPIGDQEITMSKSQSVPQIKLPTFDKIALEYPPLSVSEYADLKASIARSNGLVGTKIILDAKSGTICEGVHRAKACKELGIDPTPFFHKHTFKDEIDKRSFIAGQNLARRNLKPEQREEILINNADWRKSDRALAKEHCTNRPAIKQAREKAEATGKSLPVEKRVGGDGRTRKQPASKPAKARVQEIKAEPSSKQDRLDERIRKEHEGQGELFPEWWKQESDVIAAQMADHFTVKQIGAICATAIDLKRAKDAEVATLKDRGDVMRGRYSTFQLRV
jgi:hypothetical protein